jgi:hypothetical protein
MTPALWQGVTERGLHVSRIIGFVGPDESGGGRGVVVQYATHEGIVPRLFHVVVPVDERWWADSDFAVREVPAARVANWSIGQIKGEAPDIDRVRAHFAEEGRAARMAARVRQGMGKDGGPMTEAPLMSTGLLGATPGYCFLLYDPPGAGGASTRAIASVEHTRWMMVPKVTSRPAGDRAAYAAGAAVVAPLAVVHDLTVAPVQMLRFWFEYRKE